MKKIKKFKNKNSKNIIYSKSQFSLAYTLTEFFLHDIISVRRRVLKVA